MAQGSADRLVCSIRRSSGLRGSLLLRVDKAVLRLPRPIGRDPPSLSFSKRGSRLLQIAGSTSRRRLKRSDCHQSLNVGSTHPPQTQGNVQSAVRLALSGMYLLQASALTGLMDCQMTSKVPERFTLPIMTGLER